MLRSDLEGICFVCLECGEETPPRLTLAEADDDVVWVPMPPSERKTVMTPKGLIKLTAVANNIEALRDWQTMVIEAECYGMSELVTRIRTAAGCGLAPIDSCRKRLIKAMVLAGYRG